MAVKDIYQLVMTGGTESEESVLREKAQEVKICDESCTKLIEDLRDTMKEYPFCCGLSAPQIGILAAISVVKLMVDGESCELVLINPKIVETKGKKDKKREACMSIWGKQGEVERRDKVVVEYRDINFNLVKKEFSGYESRCIQHEIDHLNGVLYVDKLVPNTELVEATYFQEYLPKKEK